MAEGRKYVDCLIVAGGRKLAGRYTYALPEGMAGKVRVGTLLLVPVRKKLRFGVAMGFPDAAELEGIRGAVAVEGERGAVAVEGIRDVVAVYDGPPMVSEEQVAAAKWLGAYYVVPPVPAMKPFLVELRSLKPVEYLRPSDAGKLRSKLEEMGLLFIHKDTAETLLEGKRLGRRKLERLLAEGGADKDKIESVVSSFIADGVLEIEFEIEHRRRISREDSYIKLVGDVPGDGGLKESEQEMVDYIRESTGPLSKKSLMEEFPKGARVLNALKKKGIVVEYTDPSLSYEPSDDPPGN